MPSVSMAVTDVMPRFELTIPCTIFGCTIFGAAIRRWPERATS